MSELAKLQRKRTALRHYIEGELMRLRTTHDEKELDLLERSIEKARAELWLVKSRISELESPAR